MSHRDDDSTPDEAAPEDQAQADDSTEQVADLPPPPFVTVGPLSEGLHEDEGESATEDDEAS